MPVGVKTNPMQFNEKNPLKIGTRGSPLALAQATQVRGQLMQIYKCPEAAFQIIPIKTTGDTMAEHPLGEIGGKGLFSKEIEDCLLDNQIDIAVHSMKDMAVNLPAGLVIDCILARGDVRDGFLSRHKGIMDLPKGAVFGTSSLRRAAQIRRLRKDIKVVPFRGNVQTRLAKLDKGVAEATFLAMAGLHRLGMAGVARPMEVSVILPALAQGAIGVQRRENDDAMGEVLCKLDNQASRIAVEAERALLAGLDGSCRTPIAGLAVVGATGIVLQGEVLRPDGSESYHHKLAVGLCDGAAAGAEIARVLRDKMGANFFDE